MPTSSASWSTGRSAGSAFGCAAHGLASTVGRVTTESVSNVRVVPGQRTELTRTEAAVHAFHHAWEVMVAACPGGDFAVADGVVRARTRLPMAPFNGVWQRERHVSARSVLAAVDDFAAGDLPWNVELRPGYPSELDAVFAQRGLVVTAEVPFMVLSET